MTHSAEGHAAMEAIFEEIRRALQAGCYYVALVTTLSLPDVCAALESGDGETTSKKYQAWCLKWVKGLPALTTKDLYALRCGVMHQGRVGHPNMQYDRIIFGLPNAERIVMHNVGMKNFIAPGGDRILTLDTITFCNDIIAAAQQWYMAQRDSRNVQTHLPKLVQYRPQGLQPYMEGVPVIS